MPTRITIDDNGLSARWAAAMTSRARRSTALATVHDGARVRGLFAENQLIADAGDERTMDTLRAMHQVRVGEPWTVPEPPDGMDPEKFRSLDGMPQICSVQFDGTDVDPALLADHLDDVDAASFSSRAGAGTLALGVQLRQAGARVLPNSVGRSLALPPTSSVEGGNQNPYTWPEFSGSTRLTAAWQIVDAYRQLSGRRPTVVMGILDGGFWINDDGSQGRFDAVPEFTVPVQQWNLSHEGHPAGGGNQADGPMWHGQWVASLACAPHNNRAGVAGAGGTVATPFLFTCDLSCEQVIRGVQAATAWGIDVMNMSFSIQPGSGPFRDFSESPFNAMFQWAMDNKLIIVCGAGNENSQLPDFDIRPATRTPGTITVGGLDGKMRWVSTPPTIFERGTGSNYGSSVDIWAPATNLHVGAVPGDTTSFTQQSGTSGSAPLVAGTVAMMKYIRPDLDVAQVLHILKTTGWTGSPDNQVKVGLDAAAAVWTTMGHRFPDDSGEPGGGTPETAAPLSRRADGVLVPATIGARAISRPGDVDWFSFVADDFRQVTVTLLSSGGFGDARALLVEDDADGRSLEGLQSQQGPGRHTIGPQFVAPGSYRIKVHGPPSLYELSVVLAPAAVFPDAYEPNNSMQTATTITFAPRPGNGVIDPGRGLRHRRGYYELTLHHPNDTDVLHLRDIPAAIGSLREPVIEVDRTDTPVTVELLAADGAVRAAWPDVRRQRVVLPEGEAWVRISASGGRRTRYGLRVDIETATSTLPGPRQKADLSPIPDWWPDGGLVLRGWDRYLQVEIDDQVLQTPGLLLTGPGLTLHLLDEVGAVLAEAVPTGTGSLRLPLDGVAAGTYVVRIGRDTVAAESFSRVTQPIQFQLGPIM